MNLLDQAQSATGQFKAARGRVNKRVAHIDADFLAYQIAADTREEMDGIRPMRSLEFKLGQIEDIAQSIMERAGAERYVLHCTPGASTKGGRAAQAVQKEYQANRLGKEKPEHLDAIRGAIATADFKYGRGLPHLDQEADDGLVQANLADLENAILCSSDKDLRMAAGWHMDMTDDELVWVEPGDFGHIDIQEHISASGKTKTKKLVGYGPKFFWAQCLMGDTADNIMGLPVLSQFSDDRIRQYGPWKKDYDKVVDPDTSPVQKDRIKAKWLKTKKCGPVKTFELLHDLENNKDAFQRVKSIFEEANRVGKYEFTHWKTGAVVTPTQALLGDMLLLWMRETKDQNDVIRWLKTFV